MSLTTDNTNPTGDIYPNQTFTVPKKKDLVEQYLQTIMNPYAPLGQSSTIPEREPVHRICVPIYLARATKTEAWLEVAQDNGETADVAIVIDGQPTTRFSVLKKHLAPLLEEMALGRLSK